MAEVNKHGLTELRRTRQQSIGDLISCVKAFHERIARVYDQACGPDTNEEARILLGILSKHERRIIDHLGAYADKAPRKVLDTRIKYAPETPLDTLHKNVSLATERGREEISEAARQMSEVLLELYDAVAESVAVEEVREALQSLREFEEKEMLYALRSTDPE